MKRKALILTAILLGTTVAGAPAHAICFDPLGCSNTKRYNTRDLRKLNCDELWFVRNAILDDHNYCFKTEKGISAFGNDGCAFDDIADLELNSFERFNLKAIQQMEQNKRC
ncbi:MAG: YARHG domain-containing protein [Rhizobiales bacterium]|nr:YARHG domain-containing protein [Hyphomicrobiales bacterium]